MKKKLAVTFIILASVYLSLYPFYRGWQISCPITSAWYTFFFDLQHPIQAIKMLVGIL